MIPPASGRLIWSNGWAVIGEREIGGNMAKLIRLRSHICIVLVGLLHDTNLGDPAIFQITQHSIQEYCQRHRIRVTFGYIDIGEYKVPRYHCLALNSSYEKVRNRLWLLLLKRSFTKYDRVKLACLRTIRKRSTAVIFVGGSMIKYKQQKYLHRMIDIVLSRADRMEVPVMFSGVGVEGYDDNSEICERMKASLNRKCVKVITVRDDIKTLQTSYLRTNSRIKTAKVSDAACSLKNLYTPAAREGNTVGLGVIRGDIFAEYDGCISADDLLKLYVDIYLQIIKNGKKCLIFTNGMSKDQRFAERLASELSSRGMNIEETLCPRPQTVAELVSIITRCEAVIATRLHAGIIAYAYGIPFVGLVWNQKQRFFGESIGLPDRFFDVTEFNAGKIVKKLLCAIDAGYPDNMQAYRESNAKEIENFISDHIR